MTSILTLPPEICIKIFEYLSVHDKLKLLSVCRSWRALVNQDKKLWSHLDFSRRVNHTPSLTDSRFYQVLSNIDTEVRFISCFYCCDFAGESLLRLAGEGRKISNFTALNLSRTNVSVKVIDKLLLQLPNLRYLDLGEVYGITDFSTFSLTKLQHLKFLRCSAVNTTSFTVTLIINSVKFLELEELDLGGIPLLPGNFSGILKTFKALRILKVTVLDLDLGELVAAVKTKQSSIVKPNHKTCKSYACAIIPTTLPIKHWKFLTHLE